MKREKGGREKVSSCTWFYFSFFFIRQNVKVSVVEGNACRVVHGFMSDASIRSAAPRLDRPQRRAVHLNISTVQILLAVL